jgi:hypothetical protein
MSKRSLFSKQTKSHISGSTRDLSYSERERDTPPGLSYQSSDPPVHAPAFTGSASAAEQCPRVEGYLVKRGETNTLWKKRFVVLSNFMLLWYKSKEDTKNPSSILLDSCNASSVPDNQYGKKLVFQITSSKFSRLYHFQADSERMRSQWIDAINKASDLFSASIHAGSVGASGGIDGFEGDTGLSTREEGKGYKGEMTEEEKAMNNFARMNADQLKNVFKYQEADRRRSKIPPKLSTWRQDVALSGMTGA